LTLGFLLPPAWHCVLDLRLGAAALLVAATLLTFALFDNNIFSLLLLLLR
jgi:hypothetical protein